MSYIEERERERERERQHVRALEEEWFEHMLVFPPGVTRTAFRRGESACS